jgi:hypothetical protein
MEVEIEIGIGVEVEVPRGNRSWIGLFKRDRTLHIPSQI